VPGAWEVPSLPVTVFGSIQCWGGMGGGWRWDCITFVCCCPYKRKEKTSTPFVSPPKCNEDLKNNKVRKF